MNKAKSGVIAIFDFDGTLTKRSTTAAFLRYMFPTRFYLTLPVLLPVFLAFRIGLCSIDNLNRFIVRLYFKGKNPQELKSNAQVFCQRKLPRLLNPEGMKKLRFHQTQGHRCFLATSAYGIYAHLWACQQGFDGVVATELEQDQRGLLTGKLLGTSCYGAEKVRRLALEIEGAEQIYAYGDSEGDRELLDSATHTFYRCF